MRYPGIHFQTVKSIQYQQFIHVRLVNISSLIFRKYVHITICRYSDELLNIGPRKLTTKRGRSFDIKRTGIHIVNSTVTSRTNHQAPSLLNHVCHILQFHSGISYFHYIRTESRYLSPTDLLFSQRLHKRKPSFPGIIPAQNSNSLGKFGIYLKNKELEYCRFTVIHLQTQGKRTQFPKSIFKLRICRYHVKRVFNRVRFHGSPGNIQIPVRPLVS